MLSASDIFQILPHLLARDDDDSGDATVACEAGNDYDGHMGARISAIFVILIAGTFGALFPIVSSKVSGLNIPPVFFFMAKYFGSGVIVATSLIHLLQPANEALTDPCLGAGWAVYPYAYGIALVALFGTFLMELVSRRYLEKRGITHDHGATGFEEPEEQTKFHSDCETGGDGVHAHAPGASESPLNNTETVNLDSPKKSAMALYFEEEESDTDSESVKERNLAMQLGSIFVLEFGIIFHSVFIGLSLAVSGDEFVSLYIVLVFHQMFEGLGLGTRIAVAPWPQRKSWIPWALGIAYGFTTPISIAIGLGVRESYPPGSHRALVTNGVFDSISAGILIYVGLVELVGNEFMHKDEIRRARTSKVLLAYACMATGAGIMALLGRWA